MNGPNPASVRLLHAEYGIKLAVPYNHDRCLFDLLKASACDIAEIFVPVPLDVMGTFRPWNGPDPAAYRASLPGLVERARSIGVEVNMAMNAPRVPMADYEMVSRYVGEAIQAGVSSFTVGDLHLAETIRDRFPDVRLVASATADIVHVTRARHWVRQVGVERIVPSRVVNKDFAVLQAIRKLGVVLELIPNEQCLPACPYMFQHAMTIGLRDSTDERDFSRYCVMCSRMKTVAPWEHYQTEIVPASLKRYAGLAGLFKIAGRDSTTAFIIGEIERFRAARSEESRFLGGYREPSEVIDAVSSCDRVCETCRFCEKTFRACNPGWEDRASEWCFRVTGEKTICPPSV